MRAFCSGFLVAASATVIVMTPVSSELWAAAGGQSTSRSSTASTAVVKTATKRRQVADIDPNSRISTWDRAKKRCGPGASTANLTNRGEKLLPEVGQLLVADTADRAQPGRRGRHLARHGMQYGVAEDNEGRNVALVRKLLAQRPQRGKQPRVILLAGRRSGLGFAGLDRRGRRFANRNRRAFGQRPPPGRRQRYGVEARRIGHDQPQAQEFIGKMPPRAAAEIRADAVSRQPRMAPAFYFLIIVSEQHVDDVGDSEGAAVALAHAVNAREHFLGLDRGVVRRPRLQAVIAGSAVLGFERFA